MDKRRDWAGSCPFDPPPTPGVATWELLVPKCTASFALPTALSAGALLARCVLGLVVLSCKGHAGLDVLSSAVPSASPRRWATQSLGVVSYLPFSS